jgi:predicted transglutaminase-like cysteine proteinase
MARLVSSVLCAIIGGALFADHVEARSRISQDPNSSVRIADAAATLAPFQHVRFCLHYPSECESAPNENERIELNAEALELLKRINHSVNESILPMAKAHGADPEDGWTIAPAMGDCNDYAVTKRHELLASGLPARAMRLSVVKTTTGIGHLVLVIVTTKGDLVLDNLTESIRSWQNTDYHWLKIQSAEDARFWYEVRASTAAASASRPNRQSVRVADR